jgi:hypothetical protein
MPSTQAIKAQSIQAYRQWSKQWREHSKAHAKFKMHSMSFLEGTGIGKAILLVANGYSFEENLETIKEHQEGVDIMCCDKTLGHLIENGIIPKYCLLADANVSYEKYCEKWEKQLEGVILIANVCANPKWTHQPKWKDMVFFVNEDVMKYEREFMALSGCQNVIPAGTNVSNAMVIFCAQANNSGRRNVLGYDKMILIGFDYSWGENYYSFDGDNGKINYMRHMMKFDNGDRICWTSHNLAFSADWLTKYVTTFRLPVVNGSNRSILRGVKHMPLAEQMQYAFNQTDVNLVKELNIERAKHLNAAQMLSERLNRVGFNHHLNWLKTTA